MKFTTDSYIEIGNSHNICEDYALNGVITGSNGDMPFIIVADGCSSSKMTDVGSRIMALSCKKAICERYPAIDKLETLLKGEITMANYLSAEIFIRTKHIAMTTAEQFGLPYSVCDATLLYAFIYSGRLYINAYGDGNIIIKTKEEGECYTYWINLVYESNAPFYMSYDMDLMRRQQYLDDERFGKKEFTVESHVIEGNDNVDSPYDVEAKKPSQHFMRDIDITQLQSITLASDGMESFSHSHKRLCTSPAPSPEEIESLKPANMMWRMVAYKNFNGEFVKRRMKKMKQEVEKIQGEHYDDISSATIRVNHGE